MAIKLIVNGYFRSGTTAIWKMLKDNNMNYTVFYEPFHDFLFRKVEEEREINSLHGLELWDEYRNLSKSTYSELKKKYVFKPNGFSNQLSDYVNYLEVFNNISENVILQPNRLSFYLKDITEYFDIDVIHVIRNPRDVYCSILKMTSVKKFNLFKNLSYPIIKKSRRSTNILHSGYICNYVNKHIKKIPKYYYKKWIYNDWEMFYSAWIFSNYYALVGNNSICLKYEDLICRKEKVNNQLKNLNSSLRIDLDFFKSSKKLDLEWENADELRFEAMRLGLEKEFLFIRDQINK